MADAEPTNEIPRAETGGAALATEPYLGPKYRLRIAVGDDVAKWDEAATKAIRSDPIETESFIFKKKGTWISEEHCEIRDGHFTRLYVPQWHLFPHYRIDVRMLTEGDEKAAKQVFFMERDRIPHVDAHINTPGVVISSDDLAGEEPHLVAKHRWYFPYVCWVTPDDLAIYAVSPDASDIEKNVSEAARVTVRMYYPKSNTGRRSEFLAADHCLRVSPWPLDPLR